MIFKICSVKKSKMLNLYPFLQGSDKFAIVTESVEEIKSTEGIDCETINLGGGQVSVWDFAGQIEYTATHQFFLSVEVIFSIQCLFSLCFFSSFNSFF